MSVEISHLVKKNLAVPDEEREFPNGRLDLVNIEDLTLGRAVLQPGWRWSEHVRPIAKTDSCQCEHIQYVLSGHLMVVMDDGTRMELVPGDFVLIPPGHDAWVVGGEPFVAVDFSGHIRDYAQE
jgi:quercetin dioxygenase-like cupin family protein